MGDFFVESMAQWNHRLLAYNETLGLKMRQNYSQAEIMDAMLRVQESDQVAKTDQYSQLPETVEGAKEYISVMEAFCRDTVPKTADE